MARIADDELERLKREVSVQRLAEAGGVKLKQHGKELMGLCPFHEDREPSLVISPDKNLWHCLGACQAGGSVIDWVMRAQSVSFRHAAELLRQDNPALVASAPLDPGRLVKRTTVKKLEEFAEPDEPDAVVLRRVADYYHATLKQRPEALAYLRERGLVHAEVVDHFKLGFSNRTLGYRLPDKNRQAGAMLRSQLQRLGVMRESGHEHLRGSLVIPIFGSDASVLGMYGRKITPNLTKGTPLHLYLPGPHGGVFNVQALSASREVILCEALIDALTFWCAGYRNVTSSYGVEGFTHDVFDALKTHGVQKVLIAYDRDEAGERAAEKLAPELAAAGMEVFRVLFPRHMDANEYALKVQPAVKSLGTAVRAARWMAGSRPVAVTGELVREHAPAATEATRVDEAEQPGTSTTASERPDAEAIFSLAAEAAEAAVPPASASTLAPEMPSPPLPTSAIEGREDARSR
jgi:DNA primase catalytic core